MFLNCFFLAPFSIEKGILPHKSCFVPFNCLILFKKCWFLHSSSFLLLFCFSLALFSIKETYYLIRAISFIWLTCPSQTSFPSKRLASPLKLTSAPHLHFYDPIIYPHGLITLQEGLSIIDQLSLGSVLCEKLLK